ncbi:CLCN1 protein, partial [Amia calva]|nr:CLCN1 protein [Amia calva]
MMVAVILANMVAQGLQPSLYDSIIQVKKLPYLPELGWGHISKYNIFVEDIMVRKLQFLSSRCSYRDLRRVLQSCSVRTLPLVESQESMILLGSIDRAELQALSDWWTSPERRVLSQREGSLGDQGPKVSWESFAFVDEELGDENGEKHAPVMDERNGPLSTAKPQELSTNCTPSDKRPLQAVRRTLQGLFCHSPDRQTDGHPQEPPPPPLTDTMTPEEIKAWEEAELDKPINFEHIRIDTSPFQLVERTSLHKTHTLFSLLGLSHAYVTSIGKLVGVVALKEIQKAIEGSTRSGVRLRPPLASFRVGSRHGGDKTTLPPPSPTKPDTAGKSTSAAPEERERRGGGGGGGRKVEEGEFPFWGGGEEEMEEEEEEEEKEEKEERRRAIQETDISSSSYSSTDSNNNGDARSHSLSLSLSRSTPPPAPPNPPPPAPSLSLSLSERRVEGGVQRREGESESEEEQL